METSCVRECETMFSDTVNMLFAVEQTFVGFSAFCKSQNTAFDGFAKYFHVCSLWTREAKEKVIDRLTTCGGRLRLTEMKPMYQFPLPKDTSITKLLQMSVDMERCVEQQVKSLLKFANERETIPVQEFAREMLVGHASCIAHLVRHLEGTKSSESVYLYDRMTMQPLLTQVTTKRARRKHLARLNIQQLSAFESPLDLAYCVGTGCWPHTYTSEQSISPNLPRRRVDNFGEELERGLFRKLQPHWFTEAPAQEASQRCLHTCGPQADFLLAEAAAASGLDWSEIQACLPTGLIISIDPGYVACQFGSIPPSDCSSMLNSTNAWVAGGFNSTSLSSSGCSSASSISSNASSGSWPKTKYQVLYSVSSRSNGNLAVPNSEKMPEVPPPEIKKVSDDSEPHLATEAALSVLTEPDEIVNGTNTQSQQSHGYDFALRDHNQPVTNTQKAANDVNQIFNAALGDSASSNNNSESEVKPYVQNAAPRVAETNDSGVSNGAVNPFVSADATGDGAFFDSFASEAQSKSVTSEVEPSFPFNFPVKQTRMLLSMANPLDGNGEPEFTPFDYQQGPHMPTFNTAQNFIQKSTSTPSFTAATFAQTKFGSTKLKSQSKRPHRLVSPCDLPASTYSSQFVEAVGQTPVTAGQLNERAACLNDLRRAGGLYAGVPNLIQEATRTYFGNFPTQLERPHDVSAAAAIAGGFSSFFEAKHFNSCSNATVTTTNSGNVSGRSGIVPNNALWSQFEKIRNEFQLKNSQFVETNPSEAVLANFRSNCANLPGTYSPTFNESNSTINSLTKCLASSGRKDAKLMFTATEGFALGNGGQLSGFQTPDSMERSAAAASGADAYLSLRNQPQTGAKVNGSPMDSALNNSKTVASNLYADESVNPDLQDLWNSQKLGGFCWPHEKPSPMLEASSLGQVLSGLNISER
ncbi:transducer of ERBB2 [Sparganum proliferum]